MPIADPRVQKVLQSLRNILEFLYTLSSSPTYGLSSKARPEINRTLYLVESLERAVKAKDMRRVNSYVDMIGKKVPSLVSSTFSKKNVENFIFDLEAALSPSLTDIRSREDALLSISYIKDASRFLEGARLYCQKLLHEAYFLDREADFQISKNLETGLKALESDYLYFSSKASTIYDKLLDAVDESLPPTGYGPNLEEISSVCSDVASDLLKVTKSYFNQLLSHLIALL